LLVGLLSACSRPGAAVPPASPSPAPPEASPFASLPPLAAPTIHWSSCSPAGWECGTVTVPLDYSNPTGPKVQIAVNRHRATDASRRIGSLLVNPGGPGISGTDFAVNNYSSWSGLTPYFDLVGFDPRGVGKSEPIKCLSDSQLDAFNSADAWPDDPGELQTLVDEAKTLASGCQAKNGALLPHVDTVTAARDLDQIRAALGDPKITYFGYSYGTFLGLTYAHLFPTHIRALVLDSVLDPSIDETTLTVVQAEGFEKDLDDYLAGCETSQPACPFRGGDQKAQLLALLERLDKNPLPVGSRSLNSTLALTGILYTMYFNPSESWPYLSQALDREQQGDGSLLLAFADAYLERDNNGHYSNSLEANYAINCLDHPVPADPSYFQTRAQELQQVAPVFGPFVAYSDLPCRYWPVAATRVPQALDAPGAPPIVLVGQTGDPATPYQWAQAVHGQLSQSILITRTGDGHGGYDISSCVRALVNPYLVQLTVPPDGRDCPTG
jgi:pimeloyl-ACP methyl ester carboxylesterase